MPALVRISSSCPIFLTPHSRTTSIGETSESAERFGHVAADQVGVAVPGELEDPRPAARTRVSRSHTTKPVSGAG